MTKKTFFTAMIVFFSMLSFSTTYYVSSLGSDLNNGTTASTSWKSLAKVGGTKFLPGDQILLKRGDTFYGSLTVPNSGSSGKPIIFGAYGTGVNPIISGFTSVSAWKNLGTNIWESINTVSPLTTCNMVAINGVNTPMGTYPNSDAANGGFLTHQSHSGSTSITTSSLNGTTNWTGAEVVIKTTNFSIERAIISNQSGGTLVFSPGVFRGPSDGFGFFIQNDARTLDRQNEWYYNPSTKKLRVYSTSQPTDVKVASVDKLMTINQNYINIIGIDFIGSNGHAVWNNTTGSSYKSYINVQNCNISFAGISGISLRCNYLNLENNKVTYSNGSAIEAIYSNYVTIKSNTIANSGLNVGMGVGHAGLNVGNSHNCLVEYNSITNTGFNGITFFGYWVTIRNNYINTFCQHLDDGGGIYTYTGMAQYQLYDVLLQRNIIVNGIGAPNGTDKVFPSIAAGIFLDDQSKNVKIVGNTISNCRKFGLFFNLASNIVVKDNTIFGTWETQLNKQSAQFRINYPSKLIDFKANITINNNTFVSSKNNQYCFDLFSPVNNIRNFGTANYNVYARPIDDNKSIHADQPTEWSGSKEYKTFSEWKSFSGQDANSTKSLQSILSENDIRIEYNEFKIAKTITLSQPMIDMKGNKYVGSITLLPYTSKVLMKDNNPAITSLKSAKITSIPEETENFPIGTDGDEHTSQVSKVYSGTSNNGIKNEIKINIFPNPCKGKVTVSFGVMPDEVSKIEITDISGRKVVTRIISNSSEVFDLYNQSAGLYLIKSIIRDKEYVQKLVISK